jgi:hypothetical protein
MSEHATNTDDPNDTPDHETSALTFSRVFSLDEAAAMVPQVNKALRKAQKELIDLKESLILTRRLMAFRRVSRTEMATLMDKKRAQFEQTYVKWMQFFADQGVLLRDLDRGLVDFPYRADSTGDLYFLSWHQTTDDGLFYFHETDDPHQVRIPISLLPE